MALTLVEWQKVVQKKWLTSNSFKRLDTAVKAYLNDPKKNTTDLHLKWNDWKASIHPKSYKQSARYGRALDDIEALCPPINRTNPYRLHDKLIIPSEYTKNTKVVLSFGAADGGYELAKDLRERLMHMGGWDDPCAVYLDGESNNSLDDFNKDQIALDCGEAYWMALFKQAMRQAQAMVFIVTPQWNTSTWCLGEHQWLREIRVGQLGFKNELAWFNKLEAAIKDELALEAAPRGEVNHMPHKLPVIVVCFETAFTDTAAYLIHQKEKPNESKDQTEYRNKRNQGIDRFNGYTHQQYIKNSYDAQTLFILNRRNATTAADIAIANGASRVTAHPAIKKVGHHAGGALIMMQNGSNYQDIAIKINAELKILGVK